MGARPLEVADAFEAGYPFAVIGHPIAPDSDEALRRKAAEALHQCQELLLRR